MAGGLVSVFRRSVDGADNEKMLKTICVYLYRWVNLQKSET